MVLGWAWRCVVAAGILAGAGGCQFQRPVRYQIEASYSVKDAEFVQTMGNLLGPPLIQGNKVQTLINGDRIFPAMLEAIASAKRTLTFETYVYWKGEIGEKFCEALCERAQAGVRVSVLLDALGIDRIDRNYIKRMRAAGARVEEYHPFHIYDPLTYKMIDHRTHRKILVIDGEVGFTGGVGIADEWTGDGQDPKHWRDNHYRMEGPVVGQLQAAFADNWMETTGEVLTGADYFPKLEARGESVCQVFRSSSTGGAENMELMFLLSVAAAREGVCIESAYFVPDDLTQEAFARAAKRGVKVQIIVPGDHNDVQAVRFASRARWEKMLKAGVEIYEMKETMLHTKLMVVDGVWTSIGSSNMDGRSFRINDEANLNVHDAQFAVRQIEEFMKDKKRAHRISLEEWRKRPVWEHVGDGFANLFGVEL